MKPFKKIPGKLSGAFPYIYFSLVALLIFSEHLNATGTFGSELLLLAIASVFIIQLTYQFKYVNTALGFFTLFWSCWMVLAFYSDAIKTETWTWTVERCVILTFLIFNFISSISILTRQQEKKVITHPLPPL